MPRSMSENLAEHHTSAYPTWSDQVMSNNDFGEDLQSVRTTILYFLIGKRSINFLTQLFFFSDVRCYIRSFTACRALKSQS